MNRSYALSVLMLRNGHPSKREIKRAFRRRSLCSHPDRGGRSSDFIDLVQARDYLLGSVDETTKRGLSMEEFCNEAALCVARGLRGAQIDKINLTADIEQALDGSIYMFSRENMNLAVPLWLPRSIFHVPGRTLVFNVNLALELGYRLMPTNDIIIRKRISVEELARSTLIDISLGKRVYSMDLASYPLCESQLIRTKIIGLPAVTFNPGDDSTPERRSVFLDLTIAG